MIKSTRLRYIRAGSPDDICLALTKLPFKVEIKGNPIKDRSKWIVFFVIPDEIEMENVDL